MAAIPFALSISHFVSSVGADVGFASIIGLAILVLLFFAQARETASLRRRADEAQEQLNALHMYVDQLSRTPAPAPAVAATAYPSVAAPPAAARIAARPLIAPVPSVAVPVAAGAVATIPAAPAGVGAPALSAATRLIPAGDLDPISIRALKPSSNGGPGPETAGSETAIATVPPSPPPSTAAGGSNGAGTVAPAPSLEGRPANGTVAPPPRVALRPHGGPPSRPAPPPLRHAGTGEPTTDGRRLNRVALALLIALGLAIAAVGVLVLTSSSGSSPSSATSSTVSAGTTAATKASRRHRHGATTPATAAVTPASVTVAVLNGTTTNNLAHDVLSKLTAVGYKPGQTGNSAEQAVSSTIVGYTQPAYRNDAIAIAKSLNLGSASVQGVSQGDRTVACGTASACPAQVVVTVGSDLSSAA
jgi:LytR cell envelope-related transcriptional attenuator